MKDKIDQIKDLLSQIEEGQQFSKNYNALELPSIVSSIVEYLHPQLTTYEIAIY